MPQTLRLETLTEAGRLTFNIIRTLTTNRAYDERWLHGVVLGILEAKVGDMQYEFPIVGGRIDMRHGTSNPDVVELVVVRRGNEWHASQNLSELQKLCSVPYSRARRRILLILDPFGEPVPEQQMRQNYANNAMRGIFERRTVTIIYVNPRAEYTFRWTPQRARRTATTRQRI